MSSATHTTINCPNCGVEIDVNDILYHQLESELKQKYAKELLSEKERFNKELKALQSKEEQLLSRERELDNEVAKKLRKSVEAERATIEAHVREQMALEQEGQLKQLKKELMEKSLQIQELNASKAEVEKLKREKEELASRIEAKTQEKLSIALKAEREKITRELTKQLRDEEKAKVELLEIEINEKSEQLKEYQRTKIEMEKLKREKEELASSIEAKAQEKMNAALQEERARLTKQLTEQLESQQKLKLEMMQAELQEKSEQLKELQRTRLEIEKLKREKEEVALEAEVKAQSALNEQLAKEREQIRKQLEQQSEMKLKEKEKQMSDLRQQLEEARRKAEQGSMQLQGEVQELAIESWLANHFPLDTIEEIKKGSRGADCLQVVNTREMLNCGTIYYESKRTKEFSSSWIEKFKADIRAKGADIGVLVTEALPKDMERMGLYDGIWVCTYEEFKGLSMVLREKIIDIARVTKMEENRHDKMSMLYSYLTSNEFRLQIEAIVEGFTKMREGLDREKRAMTKIWKEREKQIDKVLESTIGMYGSVKGIAGSVVEEIELLELDDGN